MADQNSNASTSPRAVIWDVDGTLVDSTEYHWLACCEALANVGYVLTRERFESIIGQKMDRALRQILGPDLPAAESMRLEALKEERFRALMQAGGLLLLPGVRDWLDRLKAHGWRQGVASSAPRLNLDVMLSAVAIEPYLEAVVCAEDVTLGKPDPEPFLLAATRLGIRPDRCIVVEDAAPGIAGARAAGMRTVGVGPHFATLSADVTVASLADLPRNALDLLLA